MPLQQHVSLRNRRPKAYLLANAKNRAKKQGVLFAITESDFEIPSVCPVLGIPLKFGDYTTRDNAPSLDRKIPELGYVPGNVAVISFRANTLKRDATLAELQMLIDWLGGISKVRPRHRRQKGHISRRGNCWILYFYVRETRDGAVRPVARAKKIAAYSAKHRTLESVRPLAAEIMSFVNSRQMTDTYPVPKTQ